MISPLAGCSPLQSTPPAPAPKPPAPAPADEFTPESRSPRHRGRKLVALGLLGLGGLAGAGLAATHAAATLPVCHNQAQIAGWESGHACVSMDTALKGATAWRYAEGLVHLPGAMDSWNNQQNQVIHAPAGSPRLGSEAQELKVVSWNLHHGLSQDSTGARPQLGVMIDQLQHENADVVLMQEVAPGDASTLAHSLHMQGYYAQTTAVQGNLILLRPDIHVQNSSVTFTTGQTPGTGLQTLKEWVSGRGGQDEPRNLQVLHVEMPDGQQGTIWNTHNLTGDYPPEQRQQAAETVRHTLQEQIRPGDLVVGGGDLNANNASQAIIHELRSLPELEGQQRNIDWIYSNAHSDFSSQTVEQAGIMVSDHPLVRAQVDLH